MSQHARRQGTRRTKQSAAGAEHRDSWENVVVWVGQPPDIEPSTHTHWRTPTSVESQERTVGS
ncbi:hypothetical protein M5D96_005864, partial [Drosophila gunungcola]